MAHSSTGVLEQRTYTEGHTVTGEVSLPPAPNGTAYALAKSEAALGREKSECAIALPKRFGRYGLALHPDKTKLLKFSRPPRNEPKSKRSPRNPHCFDFLGFTHYWGRSLGGAPVVKQRTSKSRLSRLLRQIRKWCRENRHKPLRELMQALGQKLLGIYGYFGRRCNSRSLSSIFQETKRALHKWLSRRSQKGKVSWEQLTAYLKRYPLPKPRITQGKFTQQNLGLTSRMREIRTSGSVGALGG